MSVRLALILLIICLSGCVSEIWTGASLVYDRHHVYKKLSDFQLQADANRLLFHDTFFKKPNIYLEIATFNGDILIVGQVPTLSIRELALKRLSTLKNYRRLFNQIAIGNGTINEIEDSWITTKLRGQIFANSQIDPNQFKIVTFDRIVYLMGDVNPEQAHFVIQKARECVGVKRVVKLFKYYHLTDRA